MISEQQALDAAKISLAKYCYSSNPSLPEPQPVCAYLVGNLLVIGDYYLVTAESDFQTTHVLQIDADSGFLMSITPVSTNATYHILSIEEALRIVREVTGIPYEPVGRLVWRPCRESTNPIFPFYEFSLNENHIYVDISGRIYSELTPLAFGG